MEYFSEIYSTYYHAVRRVLREASEKPLSIQDIQRILTENTFFESAYHILPKLQNDWLLLKDTGAGYSALCAPLPECPLTRLQLSWLKAILNNPRICLFFNEDEIVKLDKSLLNVPLLFLQDDFYIFDSAKDGDPYESRQYQICFRVFLGAIHNHSAVSVQYEGGKGSRVSGIFWPYKLEYSSKDDKFRALCYRKTGMRKILYVLNLGRVVTARPAEFSQSIDTAKIQDVTQKERFHEVTLEVTKERNALERCMVQFAHFEKRTEYDAATDRYICIIKYNAKDEAELVIRVLSFGPTIRVLGPEHFIFEIRRRVEKQNGLIKQHINS